MNQNKENEISAILESMKGSQRAKPSMDLFAKIEREINSADTLIIPLRQLKWAAAAAILLLIVNGLTMQQHYNHQKAKSVAEFAEGESIISNYTLYDQ